MPENHRTTLTCKDKLESHSNGLDSACERDTAGIKYIGAWYGWNSLKHENNQKVPISSGFRYEFMCTFNIPMKVFSVFYYFAVKIPGEQAHFEPGIVSMCRTIFS